MTVSRLEIKAVKVLPVIAVLAIFVGVMGETGRDMLGYDREAIIAGEWWRLVTASIVHLGWPHLLLNMSGLLLIWAFFGDSFGNLDWVFIYLISALSVGLGLFFLNPDVSWYIGMSGTLHGLFSAGVVAIKFKDNNTFYILIVLLIAKLAWEQTQGSLPGTTTIAGGYVLVDAHFYGAVAGLMIGWLICRFHRHSER